MRCTQPMGLPGKASKFLIDNTVKKDVCVHCGRHGGYVCKEIGVAGMFDDLSLVEYELKNGKTAKEVVQHELWSSGPVIWLKLVTSDGQEFKWNESEWEY